MRRAAPVLLTVAALVLGGALVLWVRAGRHGEPDAARVRTYDDSTRRSFLQACVPGAGTGGEAVCSCAYERLLASVPFDRYLALEDEARRHPATSAPAGRAGSLLTAGTGVPGELERILVECVDFNRQLSTAPSPSEPPSPPGSARSSASTSGTLQLAPAPP